MAVKPAPSRALARRERGLFRGWFVASLVFGFMGLAVIPSTTEPGWGGSLFFWALAVAALVVHVAKEMRLRKR